MAEANATGIPDLLRPVVLVDLRVGEKLVFERCSTHAYPPRLRNGAMVQVVDVDEDVRRPVEVRFLGLTDGSAASSSHYWVAVADVHPMASISLDRYLLGSRWKGEWTTKGGRVKKAMEMRAVGGKASKETKRDNEEWGEQQVYIVQFQPSTHFGRYVQFALYALYPRKKVAWRRYSDSKEYSTGRR